MSSDQKPSHNWEQKTQALQRALEAALLLQEGLEEEISRQAALLREQQTIIEQQQQALERTQAEARKERKRYYTEKLIGMQQEKILRAAGQQIQDQALYIQKLEDTLVLQRKVLQQALEDSTQG